LSDLSKLKLNQLKKWLANKLKTLHAPLDTNTHTPVPLITNAGSIIDDTDSSTASIDSDAHNHAPCYPTTPCSASITAALALLISFPGESQGQEFHPPPPGAWTNEPPAALIEWRSHCGVSVTLLKHQQWLKPRGNTPAIIFLCVALSVYQLFKQHVSLVSLNSNPNIRCPPAFGYRDRQARSRPKKMKINKRPSLGPVMYAAKSLFSLLSSAHKPPILVLVSLLGFASSLMSLSLFLVSKHD